MVARDESRVSVKMCTFCFPLQKDDERTDGYSNTNADTVAGTAVFDTETRAGRF